MSLGLHSVYGQCTAEGISDGIRGFQYVGSHCHDRADSGDRNEKQDCTLHPLAVYDAGNVHDLLRIGFCWIAYSVLGNLKGCRGVYNYNLLEKLL